MGRKNWDKQANSGSGFRLFWAAWFRRNARFDSDGPRQRSTHEHRLSECDHTCRRRKPVNAFSNLWLPWLQQRVPCALEGCNEIGSLPLHLNSDLTGSFDSAPIGSKLDCVLGNSCSRLAPVDAFTKDRGQLDRVVFARPTRRRAAHRFFSTHLMPPTLLQKASQQLVIDPASTPPLRLGLSFDGNVKKPARGFALPYRGQIHSLHSGREIWALGPGIPRVFEGYRGQITLHLRNVG